MKGRAGEWIQVERLAHEGWAKLTSDSSKAAQLMHLLVSRLGRNNLVEISQKELIQLMGVSRSTVQRAIKKLIEERWIEIYRYRKPGMTNIYVVNSRVAWYGKRERISRSLFMPPIESFR